MPEYMIVTDSSCDLPGDVAKELNIHVVPLSTQINGQTYKNHLDGSDVDVQWFYGQLREKQIASTSAVNVSEFIDTFEPFLKEGKDVLYLGFSSGLSSTYEAGRMAAAELGSTYPQRKIFTVDSLSASMGQGLFVYLTAQQKQQGKSIEEARDYAENIKLNICHWFTVEDLFHLKRGGRISAASATIGTMMGIKPVMHVDNAGHLVNMEKVRGRRNSLQRLAALVMEKGENPQEQTIFISHGDCIDDAHYLEECLRKLGITKTMLSYVGPVIGTHSGPGTMAIFFIGKAR